MKPIDSKIKTSEMTITEKIYKGKVTGIELRSSDAFGNKTYDIQFRTGKAIYKTNSKKRIPFNVDDVINFECRQIKAYEGIEFIHITKVISPEEMMQLELEYANRQATYNRQ
jgi:hypothetical protein